MVRLKKHMINIGFLLFWFAMFALARDFVYRIHSTWFRITPEQFDAAHYGAMAYFKLALFLLNVTPWLVLTLILKGA